jgi:hypothetical protein
MVRVISDLLSVARPSGSPEAPRLGSAALASGLPGRSLVSTPGGHGLACLPHDAGPAGGRAAGAVLEDWRPPFPGYHLHHPSRRQNSPALALLIEALGLPLKRLDGEYFATEQLEGVRHFGVWPLTQAAQACFGTDAWPPDVALPQVSIEFELKDTEALTAAVEELEAKGFKLLHGAKTEPWGQVVARLLSAEGAIVGLSYAPSLHEA